ncbi:hypothetical protein ERY430_80427 [Erythrobacter sp. EC-HK427]|nr:hypothetical protein ERY430_80427 [Erythrobacter sp. EC-HK427]
MQAAHGPAKGRNGEGGSARRGHFGGASARQRFQPRGIVIDPDIHAARFPAGVEDREILLPAVRIKARGGENARLLLVMAHLLAAPGEGRMREADGRKVGNQPIQRMRGVEIRLCRRGIGADQIIVVIFRRQAGEHRFARALVVPVAHKALLVPVIDRGRTAQGQHHRMAEHHALQQLFGRNIGPAFADQRAETAHIVIAEEGRQVERGFLPAFIQRITIEQAVEHIGALSAAQHFAHSGGKGEIEHGRQLVAAGIFGDISGGRIVRIDFAEHMEIGDACRFGAFFHGGHERLPEAGIDMARGIDAEPVNAGVNHPVAIDIDHALPHEGVFGEQIVQPHEIALTAAFAGKGRVAAIVVIDRIVEPGGDFHLALGLRHIGRVGVAGIGQAGEVFLARILVPGKAFIDRLAIHAATPRIGEVCQAAIGIVGIVPFFIPDHVRRVVGDDIHVDLHATRMGRVHESGEFLARAEMAVGPREIGDPIAVIARALVTRRPLYRLVLENRREPDRGDAHPFEIIEAAGQARQIAALEETAMGGVETVIEAGSFETAGIVAGITVLETVGQDEVDNFIGRQSVEIVGRFRSVLGVRGMIHALMLLRGGTGGQSQRGERQSERGLRASTVCHAGTSTRGLGPLA